MPKHKMVPLYKGDILVHWEKIERKDVLIEKIKKAGNWERKMAHMKTKQLTSFCGQGK